eukprot:7358515-Heterocapsa_arctica.AAC.1
MNTIRRDSVCANGVLPSTEPLPCPSASCWAGPLVLTALASSKAMWRNSRQAEKGKRVALLRAERSAAARG